MSLLDDTTEFAAVNMANGLDGNGYPSPSVAAGRDNASPDPEAPYGRTKGGAPRRKPGPPPGSRFGAAAGKDRGGANRSVPRPGARPKPPGRPRGAQKTGTDYREGIIGLIQIPAGILGMAGTRNEDLALDGAALAMYAPPIAEALNELAQDQPAVAAALDRILAAGPYGALIGALIPLALQIAANHKLLPDQAVVGGGAMTREQFRSTLIAASGG